MIWNELHATILAKTFEKILGKGQSGAMAFVRCLTPEVVETLAADRGFAPSTWEIRRVADANNESTRTIKADRAVELRETKEVATLLLVDTLRAGAGMDGIYSAAREVDESSLFKIALRLAAREVTRSMSRDQRLYAEKAVKRARGYGHRFSVSLWTEFDFLIRVASSKTHPGALLHLLGLWSVRQLETQEGTDGLA